ncbi:PTP4 [Bracoviriform indiense]|uniref:PTP4 n=1 Tax=Bracoviriform indiense TaxID=116759 RepID=Q2THV2_9VIRU|nr:PTP4 [Bracoviriform indiense]AAZ30025.1 PTP4 [Bracoviriform indiense]
MIFENFILEAVLIMGSNITKTLNTEDVIKIPGKEKAVEFIYEEHQEIMNMKVEGTFDASVSIGNLGNTRYETEGLCFDHSRVVLSEETGSSSYINASYIDGFEHSKAYITTVTPDSEKTICKFWTMIWENQTENIVMLNEPDGNQKGVLYWNLEERSTRYCGKLNIETLKVHQFHPSFEVTKLLVTHEDGGSLFVNHFLYKRWQRIDILPPECDFLDLMRMTRLYNQYAVTPESVKGHKSPMVVHCTDGLERSMVFCAIDISISQILETGKVNLPFIVSKLRKERFNCLYDANHYCFCYSVFYYYFTFLM